MKACIPNQITRLFYIVKGITIPTYITLFRMLLVPIYGWFVIKYGESMMYGSPDESMRFGACALFLVASVSDWVDGFIARRYKMQSQLGAYLDPFADKLLLLTSIIFMTHYTEGWWQVPVWYLAIVVARDVVIIYGVWLLKRKKKPIYFAPHWAGKYCTALQIAVVSFYLLQWINLGFLTTVLASVFTLWSGVVYFRQGWHLLHQPSVK